VSEVGILIIDDDIVSQRALKSVLDSEGWRVRIVPLASHALGELASGDWNLVIVNVALTDLRGPLFAILRDLAQADSLGSEAVVETPAENRVNGSASASSSGASTVTVAPAVRVAAAEADATAAADGESEPVEPPPPPRKRIRVLFLVPLLAAKYAQPILEQEGLPYTLKPYHLHDFLEKVSELLVEAGALGDPIRSMGDLKGAKKRQRARRASRDSRRGAMFASREDYQMTEEELADFERQEEEERKKREKEKKDREHL
jgi:CheY-like chemotaxis protein